jgi:hypothetical protein
MEALLNEPAKQVEAAFVCFADSMKAAVRLATSASKKRVQTRFPTLETDYLCGSVQTLKAFRAAAIVWSITSSL